jgi:cytochrome c
VRKLSNYSILVLSLCVTLFFSQEIFSQGLDKRSGEVLYKEYCASCHGNSGDGNGELSYLVYPKPRDFTSGLFKIKSTSAGAPPIDSDLYRTILKGLPGTSMPSFNFLDESQIYSLVTYIKNIGGIENNGIAQIKIPEVLSPTQELIESGKSIYSEVGCNMCHGETGKGDGPSSKMLTDSWGYPIIPRDFTSGIYLGGGEVQDLYLRFAGEMSGTPMPSYGKLSQLLNKPKEDENELAWALVYYVKSLEEKKSDQSVRLPENQKLVASKIKRSTKPEEFMDGAASIWKNAQIYSIPISRLWQSDNVNYQMVNVQAVYNSNYIGIKMEWNDYSEDKGLYRIQDFQDGAAIQFSLDGTKGFHGMGSKDHPTDIWFWKAEWQMRANENTDSDIVLAYADRVSDSDVTTYPTLMNDMAYLSGRDAGNINSEAGKTSPVENVTAVGPQTVTPLKGRRQKIMGNGVWDGEKWRVVFVRKRKADSKEKVDLQKDELIPIGFAVWNGSEKDRNGQKMVSTWYDLNLKD